MALNQQAEKNIPIPRNRVRELPDDLRTKISSEYVINSTHTITKELIENALDAESTEIKIILSGLKNNYSITIEDNGYGIAKEDAQNLCKRNFSSKNFQGGSFGYRGEALSFIAMQS